MAVASAPVRQLAHGVFCGTVRNAFTSGQTMLPESAAVICVGETESSAMGGRAVRLGTFERCP